MDIIVKKPTAKEIAQMKTNPIWTCGVSEFNWHYDDEEHCILIEGSVTVKYNEKTVTFSADDYVIFPKGLSCVWQVKNPVKKHYAFY